MFLFSIIRMVLKRALRNFSLLLCTILGLIITVTLVSSIPLYSDAAVARLLQRELKDVNGRPPGTLLISYFAPNNAPPLNFSATPAADSSSTQDQFPTGMGVPMDTYNRLNNFITGQVPVQIRLPISTTATYGATETQRMYPVEEAKRKIEEKARYVEIAYLSDMFKQGRIKIVDGALPDNGKDKDGDIPAIVNQGTADDLRLQVGDRYVLPGRDQYHPVALTVKIVGIWDATNPDDPDWIYKPTVFDKQVFVTQDNFFKNVITTLPNEPHEYSWYYILDHTYIRPLDVNQIRIGLATINVRVNEILPETGIRISPDEALQGYEQKVFFLQLLLVALSIPTLGVVLYYIVTSVNLIVDRQRNEIALLKSRGMSTLQILGVYLLEGLLVGVIAGVLGPLLGALIAQLIGQTYGFLLFAQRKPLEIIFSEETFKYVLIAVGVAMAANLIPVIGAARNTIVSYKQEIARSAKQPFVQRFFLDFALLAVSIYGWWTLSQRTNILTFSQQGDVFVDPLLLLIPSIGIIAAALIFIRFFPLLARLASWIGERIFGVSILLALRQIARAPGQYSPIVLMLILTTALGYFSASAAHTIEQNNYDKSYYANGADMVLDERWDYDDTNNEWIPPMAVDYTQVPGVQAQARVMERSIEVSKVRPSITGSLIGVDRWDFARTAWYRSDFSNDSSSLGGLMNLLATDESAILAPEDYVAKQGLQRGSEIVLNINGREATFTLAGTFKYFPTWQPKKDLANEPVFVGNLEYIIDQGGVYPYQIWLKTDSSVTNDVLTKHALEKDVFLLSVKNARVELAQSRIDPQRTGLFGVLSVGFIVAAMLSVFSYLLYSFLSFQRRMLQFGILRATGLSVLQLTFMLVFEQIILMLVSVGVGTYIGATASNLFIPFLQVSAQTQLPPALTVPAWNDVTKIYVVLGLLLLVALISLITLLLRMKVYQAVKLGEEQ